MKTEITLRSELYNAITQDTTLNNLIGGRLYWLTPQENPKPLMVYSLLDTLSTYTLGGCMLLSHEYIDFQIDVWVKFGEMATLSSISDNLKRVMAAQGYMLLPGNTELLDGDTILKVFRWRCINV